ncbi:MAG: SPOR domain-containing protein [Pseudomonadota bacterium]
MNRALALVLCVLTVSISHARDAATVRFFQAPAWLERGDERSPLRYGVVITSGDTIVTGAGARAVLALAEGSIVKLGEISQFVIKQVSVPAAESGVFSGFLDIVKGAFRFTTTLVDRKRDVSARVGSATIGIRGTDVWGKTEEARDFVVLLEGKISIEREGSNYELDEALSLFNAPRGEAPDPIGPVNTDDLAIWAQETELQDGEGVRSDAGNFNLNLGSFRDPQGAQALIQRLARAGFAADTLTVDVKDTTWYRVFMKGYQTIADAKHDAAALAEVWPGRSSWISVE